MKKYGVLLAAVLLSLPVIGYTALWFNRAHQVETEFKKGIAEAGKSGLEIKGNIAVVGFPTDFNIQLTDFQAKINANDLKPDVHIEQQMKSDIVELSYDNMVFANEIFGTKSTLIVSKSLNVAFSKNAKENKTQGVKIKLNQPALLVLDFQRSVIETLQFMYNGNMDKFKDFERFRSLTYTDQGIKYSSLDTDEELGSYKSMTLSLANTLLADNRRQLVFTMNGQDSQATPAYYERFKQMYLQELHFDESTTQYIEQYIAYLAGEAQKAGGTNFVIDWSYKGPRSQQELLVNPSVEATIKQIAFNNKLVAFNLDAQGNWTKEDPLPYGWSRIHIVNYNYFIDSLVGLINFSSRIAKAASAEMANNPAEAAQLSATADITISSEDVIRIKAFLAKIATIEDNKLTLMVKREKNSPKWMIGNLEYEQAMALFQQDFADKLQPQPQPQLQQPQPEPEPQAQ